MDIDEALKIITVQTNPSEEVKEALRKHIEKRTKEIQEQNRIKPPKNMPAPKSAPTYTIGTLE